MKTFLVSCFLVMLLCGCHKSTGTMANCTNVLVTLSAPSCKHVGVIINGIKYPSDNLPDQYSVEGQNICIEYSFWDDATLCACCGGRKVRVLAVH